MFKLLHHAYIIVQCINWSSATSVDIRPLPWLTITSTLFIGGVNLEYIIAGLNAKLMCMGTQMTSTRGLPLWKMLLTAFIASLIPRGTCRKCASKEPKCARGPCSKSCWMSFMGRDIHIMCYLFNVGFSYLHSFLYVLLIQCRHCFFQWLSVNFWQMQLVQFLDLRLCMNMSNKLHMHFSYRLAAMS